jgi:hypothetical protein
MQEGNKERERKRRNFKNPTNLISNKKICSHLYHFAVIQIHSKGIGGRRERE